MSTATIEEKAIKLDEDGYLLDIDDWDIKVAEYLAEREGIVLTAEHWRIITAIKRVPVVDDEGRVIGIVSRGDIVRIVCEEALR